MTYSAWETVAGSSRLQLHLEAVGVGLEQLKTLLATLTYNIMQ
jgi:hypothetical protein